MGIVGSRIHEYFRIICAYARSCVARNAGRRMRPTGRSRLIAHPALHTRGREVSDLLDGASAARHVLVNTGASAHPISTPIDSDAIYTQPLAHYPGRTYFALDLQQGYRNRQFRLPWLSRIAWQLDAGGLRRVQ